jgi:hypothetical protein
MTHSHTRNADGLGTIWHKFNFFFIAPLACSSSGLQPHWPPSGLHGPIRAWRGHQSSAVSEPSSEHKAWCRVFLHLTLQIRSSLYLPSRYVWPQLCSLTYHPILKSPAP